MTQLTHPAQTLLEHLDGFSVQIDAARERADIVLLRSDPLQDIRAIRTIDAVILKGRYLDRAALDAMLLDAKLQAAKR